ncbi:MAG: IS3 family transposase, partial [Lachnospiraceae bacterium]|nr:IS3 family transposase [Lachnospiraceae bacterium]
KREKYYGRRFTSKADLVSAIEDYINYYNTQRIQRKLRLMTPAEYHEQYYSAA